MAGDTLLFKLDMKAAALAVALSAALEAIICALILSWISFCFCCCKASGEVDLAGVVVGGADGAVEGGW